jgi:hypothetical protein
MPRTRYERIYQTHPNLASSLTWNPPGALGRWHEFSIVRPFQDHRLVGGPLSRTLPNCIGVTWKAENALPMLAGLLTALGVTLTLMVPFTVNPFPASEAHRVPPPGVRMYQILVWVNCSMAMP